MKMEFYSGPSGIEKIPMDQFIGVKIVHALGMTDRQFYGDYKGQPIDASKPEQKGFMVRYPDGYESWCPLEAFLEANRQTYAMPFGHAIEAAKKGHKIARQGWNGKNMFVVYMPPLYLPPFNTQGTERKVNDRTAKWIGEDKPLDCQPYFAMYNAQGQWIPGWVASQSDMLSDDWMIVE